MACFHLLEAVAQKAVGDSGSPPRRPGPSPVTRPVGPGGRDPDGNGLVWSGASRFGPCLMRQALGRPRRGISAPESVSSSGLDVNPSGLQRAAELSSVTGKSSRLLSCCRRLFKYLYFSHQFSFTAGLRNMRLWSAFLSSLRCSFFLFKQVIFFPVFRTVARRLKMSFLLQDAPPEDWPLTRLPRSMEALTERRL